MKVQANDIVCEQKNRTIVSSSTRDIPEKDGFRISPLLWLPTRETAMHLQICETRSAAAIRVLNISLRASGTQLGLDLT